MSVPAFDFVSIALLIPALALLQGCAGSANDIEDDSSSQTIGYLALGDSYTIGESVDSVQRWPVLLAQALTEAGLPVEEPRVIARTGWTTDELDEGIDDAELDETYGLVSLLIGVNNQYRGRDTEEYRAQLQGLLQRAVGFADGDPGRVLVLSIPDWGVMPFAEGRDRAAIAREIDAFNRIKEREAERMGVHFVDITDISRLAASDPDLVAADGLHPSGTMYRRWVEKTLPVADSILRASGLCSGGQGG